MLAATTLKVREYGLIGNLCTSRVACVQGQPAPSLVPVP